MFYHVKSRTEIYRNHKPEWSVCLGHMICKYCQACVARQFPLSEGAGHVSRAVGRLRQPSMPVHWFRAHGLRMRKLHCYRVEFSRLTCVSRTESDWNSRMYCLVPVRDLATPLGTQFGPLTNSSGSTFAPLSPLPTQFGPLSTVPLPLGSRYT